MRFWNFSSSTGHRAWGSGHRAQGMEHGALINYDLRMTNDEWASDCLGGFHGAKVPTKEEQVSLK